MISLYNHGRKSMQTVTTLILTQGGEKVQRQMLVTATAFDHRAAACCHNIKSLGLQSTLTSEVPPSNSWENPTNPSLSI